MSPALNSTKMSSDSHISAAYDGTYYDYVFVQSPESITRYSVDVSENDATWSFKTLPNGKNAESVQAWYVPGNDPMAVVQYSNGFIDVLSYSYGGDLNYNKPIA